MESSEFAVRRFELRDLDAVIELGSRLHGESRYGFLPYEESKVREIAAGLLHTPDSQVAFVAERNGEVIGVLGGYLIDYFFCRETLACDMVFFVDKSHRGSPAAPALIRAFQQWAREHGAREVCLGVSSKISTERTERLYRMLGFEDEGALFKQRLR